MIKLKIYVYLLKIYIIFINSLNYYNKFQNMYSLKTKNPKEETSGFIKTFNII